MARIVTVYSARRDAAEQPDMATIRWFEISAALSRLGHDVDVAVRRPLLRRLRPVRISDEEGPPPRLVPLARLRWGDYDAVLTQAHEGFRTLERYGGAGHGFVISKLGSVVGREEMAGIYFFGRRRRDMFAVQERIARRSRYVSLLSVPAVDLWRACFGDAGDLLLVPGAAPARVPPPGPDPYPEGTGGRCLFAGNFYTGSPRSQPEAHRLLTGKLNQLGALLSERGERLYVLGPGDARSLDPAHVTYLGTAAYRESWDWLRRATVGIVVSEGSVHNRESTKIYHYLRVGLPTVTERDFPNAGVVEECGGGRLVDGGVEAVARAATEVCGADWDRDRMIRYIERHHTWDRRAEVYDRVLRERFGR